VHYLEYPTIHRDSENQYVVTARQAINSWITSNNTGDELLSNDRIDFNSTVTCYTKGFQARHVDWDGIALGVDGVIGAKTWFALGDYSADIDNRITTEAAILDLGQAPEIVSVPPPNIRTASPRAFKSLEYAIQEIGVKEEPKGSNGGPRVETYQSEGPNDNPSSGQPWCASFVSWCHYQSAEKNAADMPFNYSASSRRIEEDLRAKSTFVEIVTEADLASVIPGDILIWFRCGDLNPQNGHIGLVHHYDPEKKHLYTIEGNRKNRVWAGSYAWDEKNSDRLIRGLIGYGRV